MINRKKAFGLILALAFIALVGFKVWQKMVQSQQVLTQATERRNQPMATVPMVKAIRVKPEPIREILRLIGNIEAEEEIAVQPRINGRLISLAVEEGQAVKKGNLIGEMDDESISLQLQQSEANIANIKANLKQAELNVKKYKSEKERSQELLNNRYISQRDYDNIESTYLTTQAAWEGLNAQLLSQEKNYEMLKLQLAQTRLYSPTNGVVLQMLVSPGTNLTTGTTVAVVAALETVKLAFNVDQKDAAKLAKGNVVNFSTDAFPNQIFQGRIKHLSPIYDPKTRTLNLRASIPNPDRKLVPGMFGAAEILIGGKSQVLAVPQDAIVTQENRRGVFLVATDRTARFQEVVTGLTAEGKIEITSGLKDGDLVIVIGQNRLRNGQPVQLLEGGSSPGTGENGRTTGSGKKHLPEEQKKAGVGR